VNVHNHGTEEGPGLACREQLIGACQLDALRAALQEAHSALTTHPGGDNRPEDAIETAARLLETA
jgi:hypothetical protein